MKNKSVAERKRSNEIMSELVSTQHVLKNKFKQALANRLNHENNLNQAMEPLRASIKETETQDRDDSLRNLSILKNTASQLRLATKSYLKQTMESRPIPTMKLADDENVRILYNDNIHNNNPNELCDRLRLLIATQNTENANHVEEIKTILAKLHDLDLLV